MIYPVTAYVSCDYLDASADPGSFQEPSANSTVISHQSNQQIRFTDSTQETVIGSNKSSQKNCLSPSLHGTVHSNESSRVSCSEHDQSSNSVGHISHIPRPTPSRTTYTIPSIINTSCIGTATEIGTTIHEGGDLFGMIKLQENDVCYTSGTIEWVGKKRSFPINSGFKIINESQGHETLIKRHKTMNKTYTCGVDKIKECDCADVLPTVNAIVDHLNALHEAVDLVDMRINTLEEVLSKDNNID